MRRDVGLGSVRWLTLAEARREALTLWQSARRGGDPLAERRKARTPTFRAAAEKVGAAGSWKGRGADSRRSALERYCGRLMDLRLDQIRRRDVISVLEPVMAEKPPTGRKLHVWIGAPSSDHTT